MNYVVKYVSFIFLIVFLVTACSKNKQVQVGFLIHSLDRERWENDMNFFVEKVQDLGGTVEVRVAGNNPEKQLKQARELLALDMDVLVVIPADQFAAAQIVENAHAKNKKVIAYDRLIKNCSLDYYISTDNVEIGKLQAEFLTTILPSGKYALIGGAANDNNSQFLYLGQMNVLQPLVEKGDINIVYSVFTERWDEDEGYGHTKKLLDQTPDVDAIIAGNDALAMGVVKALREAGKEDDVLLAGMDADLQNLREIVAGHQTCTIYKPYEKLASTAAELAVNIGQGEDVKIFQTVSNGAKLVPTIFHNGIVVTKENLKLTVISEGYQTEEEIYK